MANKLSAFGGAIQLYGALALVLGGLILYVCAPTLWEEEEGEAPVPPPYDVIRVGAILAGAGPLLIWGGWWLKKKGQEREEK